MPEDRFVVLDAIYFGFKTQLSHVRKTCDVKGILVRQKGFRTGRPFMTASPVRPPSLYLSLVGRGGQAEL